MNTKDLKKVKGLRNVMDIDNNESNHISNRFDPLHPAKVNYTSIANAGIVINHQTGEIEIESKQYKVEKEPTFVKMYVDDIGKVLNLTDKQRQMVMRMACMMGYDGIIPLTGPLKTAMMEQLGIKSKSLFDRRIKALKDDEILLPVVNPYTGKVSRGLYCINPKYFAKGSWKDIKKLRLSIEYTTDSRRMITETNMQDGSSITQELTLDKFDEE